MLIKSINATLQAPGLKVQLLLLRTSCSEVIIYVTLGSYAWFSAREVCRVNHWWCIGAPEDAINALAKHQVTFS